MIEFEYWQLLFLPVFFGLGWAAARVDIRHLVKESRALPRSYFQGLNFLLNEQPDRAIEALDAALQVDGDVLLTEQERTLILAARDTLAILRQGSDDRAIEDGTKALEKAAEAYVERRMNASIRAAMAGHRVDEFKG